MNKQEGQILILGIVVMAILMAMSASLWGYTVLQVQASRQAVYKSQALQLAEAGMDKAMYELSLNPGFKGETNFPMNEGVFTTEIAQVRANGKQIVSTGYVPNSTNPKSKVTIRMQISTDMSSVIFRYAVQSGAGGLTMANNSQANGSVYSNGDIRGGATGSGTILNDATVAGSGNVVDDTQCATSNGNFPINQSDRRSLAQKFSLTKSGRLSKVSLYVKKVGSPSDATVRIVADSNNTPSLTQIGSVGTIAGASVLGSYTWVDASFSNAPDLTANTSYWLVLDTTYTAQNYYTWAQDSTGNNCPGSGAYASGWGSGAPWSYINGDFNFKTFIGGVPTKLSGVRVKGTAKARSLENCTIGIDAYYYSVNTCTVGGVSRNNQADSPTIDMPLPQTQIDSWKNIASAGGEIVGNYTVDGTQTLGPKKITGDLTVNGTLYLTGPVWVEGNITLANNSAVRGDASLASAGAVLLADKPSDMANTGLVNISNNVVVAGNDFPGSYIMILTTKSGPAMNIYNNSVGAIYYAANGIIELANNAVANHLTAYEVRLNENALITYMTGPQAIFFSNGSGGGWSKTTGTYIIDQ